MRTLLEVGLAGVLCVAVACGGDGGRETDERDPPVTDSVAAEAPEPASGPDRSAGAETGSAGAEAEGDVPEIPLLGGDSLPELRAYRLLLVNRRAIEVVVSADAGAGTVVLDTVPRLDSARVNVEVQAERIRLVAEDRWGERLGAWWVELRPDSLVRWEVP